MPSRGVTVVSRDQLTGMVDGHSDDEIVAAATAFGVDQLIDEVLHGQWAAFQADRAAGQQAVILWEIAAPDAVHQRTITVDDGAWTIGPGPAASARLVLAMSLADFLRLQAGRIDGLDAFLNGKLKMAGDIGFPQTMQQWFA
jgi:putative sterol carrier protein